MVCIGLYWSVLPLANAHYHELVSTGFELQAPSPLFSSGNQSILSHSFAVLAASRVPGSTADLSLQKFMHEDRNLVDGK